MPRTFAYVRVSTAGQTTDNQLGEITAAGFAIEQHRVVTETVSGSVATAQRRGFTRLLNRLEAGDVLVVSKLDRLGRNAMDVGSTVAKLAGMGVRVHCLALGGVDLASSTGKLTMNVINAVAEFERDLLIERTQAGLSRAKAEGKRLGRPASLTREQRKEVVQRLGEGATVGGIKWSLQHHGGGVAMKARQRRSDRALRGVLRSPGRPGVARREDRCRFWAAIALGLASEAAAARVGVSPAVGARWFREAGGMPPWTLAPSSKPLSGRYLSLAEREEIALWRVQGHGVREIARRLGRAGSTISRELRRNAATRGGDLAYRASTAQWHAERAARRPKPARLALNAALRTYVQDRLAGAVATPGGTAVAGPVVPWKGRRRGRRQDRRWARAWSPQQIAQRLRRDFPGDETMRISHEAIYQALYVQGRGALRRELTACLRTGRALRVPRARSCGRGKSFIAPEIMISQRPAEAADRAVPGHWEGDLILGLGSSAIGTLVERATRFTMLLHLPRMVGHGDARERTGPHSPDMVLKRCATPSRA